MYFSKIVAITAALAMGVAAAPKAVKARDEAAADMYPSKYYPESDPYPYYPYPVPDNKDCDSGYHCSSKGGLLNAINCVNVLTRRAASEVQVISAPLNKRGESETDGGYCCSSEATSDLGINLGNCLNILTPSTRLMIKE